MSTEETPESAGGLLDRLADTIGARVGAASVFGTPVEREGVTVIPVARSHFAFGGGGGDSPTGTGEGGGGAGISRPVGFIELRDGHAHFRRTRDPVAVGLTVVAVAAAAAILAGGVVSVSARTLPSSTRSSKPAGVRTHSMRASGAVRRRRSAGCRCAARAVAARCEREQ